MMDDEADKYQFLNCIYYLNLLLLSRLCIIILLLKKRCHFVKFDCGLICFYKYLNTVKREYF